MKRLRSNMIQNISMPNFEHLHSHNILENSSLVRLVSFTDIANFYNLPNLFLPHVGKVYFLISVIVLPRLLIPTLVISGKTVVT